MTAMTLDCSYSITTNAGDVVGNYDGSYTMN